MQQHKFRIGEHAISQNSIEPGWDEREVVVIDVPRIQDYVHQGYLIRAGHYLIECEGFQFVAQEGQLRKKVYPREELGSWDLVPFSVLIRKERMPP